MADEIVAYSKYDGSPCIPLTVRIDWLPDGTIIPLFYWTPDGTCYEVNIVFECVPLPFLKERGEGLRYRVRGKIIETPDYDDDMLNFQEETYLYLADTRFYQKNIIDERYTHASKEYIPVTLDVFPDGDYEVVYFSVHGERYVVEKTSEIEPRGSFKAGGVGMWHKVKARLVNADDDDDPDPEKSVRRSAALYWELNKWFVCVAKTA